MLSSRTLRFKDTLSSSSKYVVKLLAYLAVGDKDTVLRKNICKIQHDLGNQPLSVSNIKKSLKYCAEEDEMWRISFILELLQVRSRERVLDGFNDDDVTNILDYLCCI